MRFSSHILQKSVCVYACMDERRESKVNVRKGRRWGEEKAKAWQAGEKARKQNVRVEEGRGKGVENNNSVSELMPLPITPKMQKCPAPAMLGFVWW